VWLVGAHFALETACVWGVASRGEVASFVSSSLVRCEAPPLPAGAASVRAGRFSEVSEAGATFAAFAVMLSATATPAVAHADGGTHVVLAGNNFRDAEDAACAFGTIRVAAAVVGGARAACLTPAHAPGRTGLVLRVQALTDVGTLGFLFTGAHHHTPRAAPRVYCISCIVYS
jgi:hypothetical protein